ncbi:hypothetical protein [Deinococcus sonorensis]|uniref:Uncharacterized protein n=2 Tax=Deinococcus sonorensis TaxID=309891 RepID=A0AAU7UFG4_9DEIO
MLTTPLAAAAPDLKGATLCLSPETTIFVMVEDGVPLKLTGLENQLYVELKKVLRTGAVTYQDATACSRSSANLTLSLRVRPIQGSSALETQVSTRVQDSTSPGATSWMGGEYRWSTVEYGKVSPGKAEVTAELLNGTRTSLSRLVNAWKAANR